MNTLAIVPTNLPYTYQIMESNIWALKGTYPFIEVGVAGSSVLGKNLYYVKLGSGPKQVFYNGAHHALEWITTPLLMRFIENFAAAYSTGGSIRGYSVPYIWDRSSIYIMPMVNPDGVDLVIKGLSPDNPFYQDLLRWNNTGLPFSAVWQANIRGVDLNLNYPAGWEEAKALEPSFGIFGPAPGGYGGPAPLSEPESSTVVNFTRRHDFRLVIAYHSQGMVIYWQYRNLAPPEALQIAQQFANASGYTIAEPALAASFAGYKDWFIQEYRRPGFTIEVGRGVNPLPLSQFNTIYEDNEEIMLLAPLL